MSDYVPAFPNHSQIAEPELLLHPFRLEDRRRHPLLGLLEFGPYSRSTLNTVLDPIRVAIIAPHGGLQAVRHLLVEFGQQHSPRERKNYLPTFPGFSRVFGLNIVAGGIQHELSEDLDSRVASASAPHQVLADALGRAFNTVQISRAEFDVLAIYLPNRWERGFWGPKGDLFDLHDYLKAIAAARGTPTQIINEDSALAYNCRCSVMWRLGIAIYCKAGGVPWKLAGGDTDTAFVGLSYAIREASWGRPRFVTCCSQVFDAEGAGLEFVVYDTDEIHIERDNPFLSRSQMRRVMARSLPFPGVLERRKIEEWLAVLGYQAPATSALNALTAVRQNERERDEALASYIGLSNEAPILPSSPTPPETESDDSEADKPKPNG